MTLLVLRIHKFILNPIFLLIFICKKISNDRIIFLFNKTIFHRLQSFHIWTCIDKWYYSLILSIFFWMNILDYLFKLWNWLIFMHYFNLIFCWFFQWIYVILVLFFQFLPLLLEFNCLGIILIDYNLIKSFYLLLLSLIVLFNLFSNLNIICTILLFMA